MWWIIIIAIVGYVIYKFYSDRNKLLSRIESKGGLQIKYQKFISILFDELPGTRIAQVTRDTIVVKWNMGQFIILQLFDKVRITSKVNLPSGTITESQEFPLTLNQEMMSRNVTDAINRKLETINWTSEYGAINNIVDQVDENEIYRNHSTIINNELEKRGSTGYKTIKPGDRYDGIVLNKTTSKEVIRKYGQNYDINDYDSLKSFGLRYQHLGMVCIFEVNDPNQYIRSIELYKESGIRTELGVDFERNNSVGEVLNLYGPLPNEKLTKDDGYICLDYGEILFYFLVEDTMSEVEDSKLTKSRLQGKIISDIDEIKIKYVEV